MQQVKTGNMLWVDAVNGDDATGIRGRLQSPYRTLAAAKNAAMSGDTIFVMPGTYNEKNLARNGVNWHFCNGAVVSYSGTATGGIFDTSTYGAACTFAVTGFGVFKVIAESGLQSLIKSGYAGDNLKIECDRIEALGAAVEAAGAVFLRCNEVKSSYNYCIYCTTGGNIVIQAHKIGSAANYAIYMVAGTADITARYIHSSANSAINFAGGMLTATAEEISSGTSSAVQCNGQAGSLCRLRDARIVSSAAGQYAIANFGTISCIRLVNCALVCGSGATYSLYTSSAINLYLYGANVANAGSYPSITLVGGSLVVNSNLI
jgi:hypothetical protein